MSWSVWSKTETTTTGKYICIGYLDLHSPYPRNTFTVTIPNPPKKCLVYIFPTYVESWSEGLAAMGIYADINSIDGIQTNLGSWVGWVGGGYMSIRQQRGTITFRLQFDEFNGYVRASFVIMEL